MTDWLVSESVELLPHLVKCNLTPNQQYTIKNQALQRLGEQDPMLRHIMEIKVVTNQRRNFINISIRKDYLPLIHMERIDSVYYCFFMSDKLEPFIIVTAVHPEFGKLERLTRKHVDDLSSAVHTFKTRFGIKDETYHYTGLDERMETEEFVSGGGTSRENKAHSAHFHLKIRIATAMYLDRLLVCRMFDFNRIRNTIEPVRYNYNRTCASWQEVHQAMIADAVPSLPT